MKKISKNIILMITVLGLIGFYGIPNKIHNEMKGDYDELETSIEYKPLIPNSAASHPPIFIDGDDLANDWDDCDAVTGSGTIEEPYVIEDLEIDAGGSGSGIYIRDSTAYLNIVNCELINSGSSSRDSGIRVENCENLNISDCNVKLNTGNGIYLYSSTDNTLTGNTAVNNSDDGIVLYSSSNNNILTGNTAANNSNYGMVISSSSNNNILTGNTVSNNSNGILLYSSNDNTLTGNTVANNTSGIILPYSHYNTLTGNTFVNNSNYGIAMESSSNNNLTYNTAINNSHGISLYSSPVNTLTGNTVTNNSIYGIFLGGNSVNNGIFYNNINTNQIGIEIDSSSSGSILYNWIWDNTNYDIYENSGEANTTYIYNYYFAPLDDTDKDGLSDEEEFALHTNPVKIDTDDDNFLDGYEVLYGSDPLDPLDYPSMPLEWYLEFTALVGVNTALIEELWGWSNGNATLLLDMVEFLNGNSTLLETTYALAIQNVAYLSALEGNLEGNATEIRAILDELGITIGDTDYDGLDDLDEVLYETSLTCVDTDMDNLLDGFEVKIGTDPLNDDSDGDSWYDGIEVASGTNPLDASDFPSLDETPLDSNPPIGLIIGGIGGFIAIIGIIGVVFFKRVKK